jgi:hypothetical protein
LATIWRDFWTLEFPINFPISRTKWSNFLITIKSWKAPSNSKKGTTNCSAFHYNILIPKIQKAHNVWIQTREREREKLQINFMENLIIKFFFSCAEHMTLKEIVELKLEFLLFFWGEFEWKWAKWNYVIFPLSIEIDNWFLELFWTWFFWRENWNSNNISCNPRHDISADIEGIYWENVE